MKQAFTFTEQTKNIIGASIVGLLLIGSVGIFFSSQVACALNGGVCGNNGGQVGSNNGGQQPDGRGVVVRNDPPPPPPPPQPCVLTLSAPVVATGTQSMTLSWTPKPYGKPTLRRSGGSSGTVNIPLPNDASSYTDSISQLAKGTYTYSLTYAKAYRGSVQGASTSAISSIIDIDSGSQVAALQGGDDRASGNFGGARGGGAPEVRVNNNSNNNNSNISSPRSGYACSASFKIVSPLTECNDEKDNADTEDSLADRFDPGCHTDGNPNNNRTYDPLDPSEVNGPADMTASINAAARSRANRPVSVTAGAENIAAVSAESNELVFGWRNISASAPAPSCGRGWLSSLTGSRCFQEGGKTYQTLGTYNQSYNAGQERTAPSRSFRPSVAGRYEVCAVADFEDVINEGAAGERNNVACTIVTVDSEDPDEPPTPGPTITGPAEIIVSPGRVRKGTETTVSWNTNGREQCVITGTNGHVIDLNGGSSAASEATPAITSETTYVMECADDGTRVEGKVGIIPVIQEI